MTRRREFPRSVKAEIVHRATRNSQVFCEGCGAPAKIWHIDHTIPDALQIDKTGPLTAADGQLLCAGPRDSCHATKTAEQDVPAIAKAKRREAAHLGIKPISPDKPIVSAPLPTTRKAAARAARGHKQSLPPRLPPGFEPASPKKDIA